MRLFIFGALYTIVYVCSALDFIGVDNFSRSTGVFLAPVVTWFFVIWAIYLSARLKDSRNRIFFIVSLVAHYVLTILLFFGPLMNAINDEQSNLRWHWSGHPKAVVFAVAWYLAGQFVLWILFLNATRPGVRLP